MSASPHQDKIIHATSVDDLPLEQFHEQMERDTFACIRGIFSREEVNACWNKMVELFSSENDHATYGQSPTAIRENFQRLNIGGESKRASHTDARLFRVFYNPIWSEDTFGMRDIFRRLAMVRNALADLPRDFAIDKIEEPSGLWTAARVHQYPQGGGFFQGHTDYVANEIAKKGRADFYQPLLLMTQKGEHYETGGGFVDLNGERIYLEDHFDQGDIAVYDGRVQHGVEDVDPHKVLDLHSLNGRATAFVTLFKAM